MKRLRLLLFVPACLLTLTSCTNQAADEQPAGDNVSRNDGQPAIDTETEPAESPRRSFEPITIGSETQSPAKPATSGTSQQEFDVNTVIAGMQPLQIMLGKWRGTTRKKFDGFANSAELNWRWDFKSNPEQPAMAINWQKGPYFQSGRLTYLPKSNKYRFTITTAAAEEKTLEGSFTEEDGLGKLLLTQLTPETGEQWQIAFNQRDNDRYLLELSAKRTKSFRPLDTVGTQRSGTSFAAKDSDDPGPKCILTGGLGTSTVSFNGQTYWVCCSGCRDAFNDDPKGWLARAEKSKSGE